MDTDERRRCASLLLLALALGCRSTPRPSREAGTDAARPPSAGTKVVLLGTGTPRADPERWGPAIAVVAGDEAYVVDAGVGVVRRAAAAARAGIGPLAPARLRRVFLTHLHSDHTLGYPDLILSPWVLGREEPLEVWGPPGTQAMTDAIHAAWGEDIRVRIEGLEKSEPAGQRVIVHEIGPGATVRDGEVTVTAFAVAHGSWQHAYGYRFAAPDRTIVISGDTGPCAAVAEACAGCDVLVHEVRAISGFDRLPPDWRAYHSSFHTSTEELARIASTARPGLLVLVHQLLWPADAPESVLLDEIGRGWDGRVVSGHDLDVY